MQSSAGELVVAFSPDATGVARATVAEQIRAGNLVELDLRPLTSQSALALERVTRSGESERQREIRLDQSRYFSGTAEGRSVESALDELRSLPGVETAYWKPGVENPLAPPAAPDVPEVELPGVRPSDFRALQTYLGAAPTGVDVGAAWPRPGGRGDAIRVVDIEGGWRFTHTDLLVNSGGLLAGTQYPEWAWRDHGTAVLGELGGDADGVGVSGICPNAVLSGVSHRGFGSRGHRDCRQPARSRGRAAARNAQARTAIRIPATQRPAGIHRGGVVARRSPGDPGCHCERDHRRGSRWQRRRESDDVLYNKPGPNFPADWRNPFSGAVDSGAVVVGAGAPPSGAYGPDRSRLDFSNWSRRVNCHGWGRGVLTTGYGDFFTDVEDAADEDYWYTRQFAGTSSASPIVTGVVTCLQGIAKATRSVLLPAVLRGALRATGSPQTARPGAPVSQNIGSRPDLVALIRHLGL